MASTGRLGFKKTELLSAGCSVKRNKRDDGISVGQPPV
jgi:hypothetical protein